MKTLDEIMIAMETDKATVFTRTYAKPHGYAPIYDRFFTPFRNEPIKLLEIGAASGESIRSWLEYFPSAKVYGVDIVHDTNPWNVPNPITSPHERYTFVHGDQSNPVFWKSFIAKHGGRWAVVVDDGSHDQSHIRLTLSTLWPYMAPGGLYCIEDLKGTAPVMEMLGLMIQNMHDGGSDLGEAHFSRELAVMVKRA